jgi:plastocyanin
MNIRVAVFAGLAGLACGCGYSTPSSPSGGTTVSGTPVSIVNGASLLTSTAYAPSPITIAAGDTVTWTNNDTTEHTTTAQDGSWNSGAVAPGRNFSRTFPTAGSFDYDCTIHPGMRGTVIVK